MIMSIYQVGICKAVGNQNKLSILMENKKKTNWHVYKVSNMSI